MGEVIQALRSDVKVLDEQAILHEALKLMTQEQELGRGGNREEHHFSWLNRAEPYKWETGFDALEGWRFPVEDRWENEWTEFYFTGEKVGQEQLLFERIKPHMEGYVEVDTDYDRTRHFDFGGRP